MAPNVFGRGGSRRGARHWFHEPNPGGRHDLKSAKRVSHRLTGGRGSNLPFGLTSRQPAPTSQTIEFEPENALILVDIAASLAAVWLGLMYFATEREVNYQTARGAWVSIGLTAIILGAIWLP